MKKGMHPTRARVLEAFRRDPLASLRELSQATGISPSGVSLHLCALEQDGVIARPKKVQYWRTAVKPTAESLAFNSIDTKKGAVKRGEGAMRARKAKDADALQERIDRVVAKAEREGTCFSAEYVKLERLGACKCG